jgi:hypothetical protein
LVTLGRSSPFTVCVSKATPMKLSFKFKYTHWSSAHVELPA